MKSLVTLFYVLTCAANLSGCVAVSMHSTYSIRITVVEAASAMPASNVPVVVAYDYDSYGWFYFANTPDPATAVTDAKGTTVMQLADFRYRTLLRVNGKLTTLNKQLVREGGAMSVPPYTVTLSRT
jgi:hypothetical protein